MIHIVQFDPKKIDMEDLTKHGETVQQQFPDDTIIAAPMGISWMFDVPAHVLKDYLQVIQEAINVQEEQNNDIQY